MLRAGRYLGGDLFAGSVLFLQIFSNLEQYSRLAYEADEAKVEAENFMKS